MNHTDTSAVTQVAEKKESSDDSVAQAAEYGRRSVQQELAHKIPTALNQDSNVESFKNIEKSDGSLVEKRLTGSWDKELPENFVIRKKQQSFGIPVSTGNSEGALNYKVTQASAEPGISKFC